MSPHRLAIAALALVSAAVSVSVHAQTPAAPTPAIKPTAAKPLPGTPAQLRPGLLWREVWKQNAGGAEQSLGPASIANPDLDVRIYGPDPALQGDKSVLKTTGKDGDENNPSHVFSGECRTACAFTLRSRTAMADLTTPLARIRVNTKMSGLHKVYPIIKLANGDWYVGNQAQGPSIRDWVVSEVSIADLAWIKIDPATLLTKGNPTDKIDLSKVDEIGFVDPMPASGHGPGGWFDVGQIEVFAKPAAR